MPVHTRHLSVSHRATPAPVARFGASNRDVVRCRVCGRTLLIGERSTGYFNGSGEGPFDVCDLCVPRATRFGLRLHPTTPDELTRNSTGVIRRIARRCGIRQATHRRVVAAADLRSTPVGAAAIPVAVATFNDSQHARTLAGLSRTLGTPRASVVPRSPTDREVVLTVAWEIVWYQFQIRPDATIEPSKGMHLDDLPARWQSWNCRVLPSGRIAVDLSEHADEAPGTFST